MIVSSGILVLPALVLLVLGLRTGELSLVHGSIAVSLVSFAFLVIGVLQRRDDPPPLDPLRLDGPAQPVAQPVAPPTAQPVAEPARPPATVGAGAPAPLPAVQAALVDVAPADEQGFDDDQPADDDGLDDDELEPGGGPVLVVAGQPRYHVEGCRYLSGLQAEELDVLDAREDGFTACAACRPDQVLEAVYGEIPGGSTVAVSGSVPMVAPGAPGEQATVVVLPDHDRFHAAGCHFVRGAPGTQERSRTQADEQGYVPCGVCEP